MVENGKRIVVKDALLILAMFHSTLRENLPTGITATMTCPPEEGQFSSDSFSPSEGKADTVGSC